MKKLHIILLFTFISGSAFSQVQFLSDTLISTIISDPLDIFAIDFDMDDDLDLLFASWDGSGTVNTINWLENDGSGSFSIEHIIYASSDLPSCIYPSDVDGDGDVDILFTTYYSGLIGWFENLGNGIFGSQHIIYTLSPNPLSVFASDIDNDGDLDVVTASKGDSLIAWYENIGNGNFGSQQIISNNVIWPNNVLAGDMDNDGDMDVISSSILDNKIAWYENIGNGNFGSQQIISVQTYFPISISAGDIDNDGDIDIAVSAGDDEISWFENLGNTTFSLEQVICDTYHHPRALKLIDIDNDSDLDIIFSAVTIHHMTGIIKNNGAGNFAPVDTLNNHYGSRDFCFADINGDSINDLIGASYLKLFYFPGDSNTLFSDLQFIIYSTKIINSMIPGDINNDGYTDVAIASSEELSLFLNNGNGNLVFKDTIFSYFYNYIDMHCADIDNDGLKDLVTVSWAPIEVLAWFKNTGNGSFSTMNVIKDSISALKRVFVADLDGDMDQDVIFTSISDNSTNDEKLGWFANDGNGNFGPEVIIFKDSGAVSDVCAADMDYDGDMDLLVANGEVRYLQNDGTGNFSQTWITTANSTALRVDAADIDGDSILDMVFLLEHYLIWLKNDGTGYFWAPSIFNSNIGVNLINPSDFSVVDIDLDGDLDVVCESNEVVALFWYENDGTGAFGPAQGIENMIAVTALTSADIDNDGDTDILYNDFFKAEFFVSYNQGYLTPQSALACENEPYPFGNQQLTAPGTYYDSLQSSFGLDSVIELYFAQIPTPQVDLAPFPQDTVCVEDEFIGLPLGQPAGGEYLGSALYGSNINLAEAGEGLYTLAYTYTDTMTGCSDTAEAQVQIVVCTLVEETGSVTGINIYPNPSKGMVYIETPNTNEIFQYQVCSVNGQILESGRTGISQTGINLQNLNSGIYYLRIQSEKSQKIWKIILE